MDFEVTRSEESVKIYGVEYSIIRPTVESVEKLQSMVEDLNGEEKGLQVSKKWVSSLGIPMDVISGMEMNHFSELMEFFTDSNKKK